MVGGHRTTQRKGKVKGAEINHYIILYYFIVVINYRNLTLLLVDIMDRSETINCSKVTLVVDG